MAQTLNLKNFDSLNLLARTSLTGDIVAAVAALPVENTNDFQSGPVLVGAPGGPMTELVTATTISTPNSIPLAANTKEAHNFGEAVLMLFGDRIRIYRANDQYGTGQQPDDTNFTLLATVNIDGGKTSTTYTDSTGTAGQWYKYTYYNSTTTSETLLADSAAGQAGQQHYVGIDDIREAAGFSNNPNVTDARIAAKRDAAEKEINGALIAIYALPFPQPTNPILVEIAKQLAAGMLMHELYVNVSPAMAMEGEAKAKQARQGGGVFTGLQELVTQDVILLDAQFNDTSTDENVHGFGGYPDETTTDAETGQAAPYFTVDEIY